MPAFAFAASLLPLSYAMLMPLSAAILRFFFFFFALRHATPYAIYAPCFRCLSLRAADFRLSAPLDYVIAALCSAIRAIRCYCFCCRLISVAALMSRRAQRMQHAILIICYAMLTLMPLPLFARLFSVFMPLMRRCYYALMARFAGAAADYDFRATLLMPCRRHCRLLIIFRDFALLLPMLLPISCFSSYHASPALFSSLPAYAASPR